MMVNQAFNCAFVSCKICPLIEFTCDGDDFAYSPLPLIKKKIVSGMANNTKVLDIFCLIVSSCCPVHSHKSTRLMACV